MKKAFLIAALLFAVVTNSFAVIAYPGVIKFKQPDNKTFLQIYLFGDERFNWGETLDGYSLVHDDEGYFVYATQDARGDMQPTQYRATEIADRPAEVVAFLERTPKHLRYSDEQRTTMRALWNMLNDNPEYNKNKIGEKVAPVTIGSVKLLVILVNFSNKTFTKDANSIAKLFNQVNYRNIQMRGSVHDFYFENSYGQMDLTFDVVGPYTLPQNIAYYGSSSGAGGSQAFGRTAIQLAVSDSVNLSDYDNNNDNIVDGIHIMFAGYGEESSGVEEQIWSHKGTLSLPISSNGVVARTYSCSPEFRGSSGTTLTAIGVICHELGHVFGAPDYYDTDNNHGGSGTEGFSGNGKWDIMSSGSWNGTSSSLTGNQPSHHNPYTKCYTYSWATPTDLTSPRNVVMYPTSSDSSAIYKLSTTTSNEYYLIENRQNVGFDQSLPGHGMIVFHVHSAFSPSSQTNNVSHQQRFYPVCSGLSTPHPTGTPSSYGNINSNGCPFPGTYRKTSFTDNTTPAATSWSGQNTNKPITNITENTTLNTISFTFMGAATEACDVKAVAHNKNQINIKWRPFGTTEVMLAYSANGVFGTPSGNYSVGQTISGGGTVLYIGDTDNFAHTGLTPGTNYKYKVFTKLTSTPTWSTGLTCNATTPTCNATPLPYSQNFASTSWPSCWSTSTTNSSVNWQIGSGNGASNPSSAYSAPYNAYCKITDANLIGEQAFLISEPLDLSSTSEANISFAYCNTRFSGYLDVLTVVYRSSYGDDWSPLATFSKSVSDWTEVSINLPNLSDYYQIAFIATTNKGRGVCVDNIQINNGNAITPVTVDNPKISIYPNPAKSSVTFSIEGNDEQNSFSIYDLKGTQMISGTMQGGENKTISVSKLQSGMYFVRFQNDKFQKTETLIIK